MLYFKHTLPMSFHKLFLIHGCIFFISIIHILFPCQNHYFIINSIQSFCESWVTKLHNGINLVRIEVSFIVQMNFYNCIFQTVGVAEIYGKAVSAELDSSLVLEIQKLLKVNQRITNPIEQIEFQKVTPENQKRLKTKGWKHISIQNI